MTDHKYTDDEIIHSLKVCSTDGDCIECLINPHKGNYGYCTSLAIKAALDLINRQKAEIESLQAVHADMTESLRLAAEANKDMQAEIEKLGRDRYQILPDGRLELIPRTDINAIKAEAIKEFAERVKGRNSVYATDKTLLKELNFVIDNLVKEMTEENK